LHADRAQQNAGFRRTMQINRRGRRARRGIR
jgi:hypothetical protein